jgi:hypothetical protein
VLLVQPPARPGDHAEERQTLRRGEQIGGVTKVDRGLMWAHA